MNSRLPLLHPVADDIPIVGGRSQRYFEFTTRVSPLSTLRRAHLGSRSSGIGVCRPPTTVGTLVSSRRQLRRVSRCHSSYRSMRYALQIPNWKVHSLYNVSSCILVLRLLTVTVL